MWSTAKRPLRKDMPPRQQHRRHRDRGQSDRCVTSLSPNEQARNVSGPLRFDGASGKHGAWEARRDHRPDITLEVAHTAKHAREGNHTNRQPHGPRAGTNQTDFMAVHCGRRGCVSASVVGWSEKKESTVAVSPCRLSVSAMRTGRLNSVSNNERDWEHKRPEARANSEVDVRSCHREDGPIGASGSWSRSGHTWK